MRRGEPTYRYKLFALLGVGLLGLSIFTVVASYTRMFAPVVNAEVLADRSGLLLERKADVTLRGVTVGEATNIVAVDGKARIEIAVDREYAERIPANVGARIVAPTVFGAKFIDLVPPRSPRGDLAAGAVIRADHVATETDTMFDSVMNLLTAVEPAKLNATLGAVATALRGQGEDLGRFLTDLNTYLTRFNPTLPTVDQALRALPDVTDTYADAAPDLLRVGNNASTLATTLHDKERGLHALLLSMTRAAGTGSTVLADNGERFVDALDIARPTTELLAYYAPELPCVFEAINTMRRSSAKVVGGKLNGINGLVTVTAGQEGYKLGRDDPKLVEGGPPKCYPTMLAHGPHYEFDDGTSTVDFYRRTTEVVPPGELARRLLGPSIEPFLPEGVR